MVPVHPFVTVNNNIDGTSTVYVRNYAVATTYHKVGEPQFDDELDLILTVASNTVILMLKKE